MKATHWFYSQPGFHDDPYAPRDQVECGVCGSWIANKGEPEPICEGCAHEKQQQQDWEDAMSERYRIGDI